MGAEDLKVNRAIRRVLVKHWIDLGRLSVRSHHGDVILYGRLQRISGAAAPLTPRLLEAMFYEMSRLRGVRGIRPHFENWIQEDGGWREISGGDSSQPLPSCGPTDGRSLGSTSDGESGVSHEDKIA